MCKMSILSIMKWTNFNGDIVVLSDSDHLNDNIDMLFPNVRVINILDDIKDLSSEELTKFNIYCLKPLIKEYVDLDKYDFSLYLDSDILIKTEKLNEIFKFWSAIDKVQLLDNEGWNVEKWVPSTGSQILDSDERVKFAKFGVCAGAVGLPKSVAKQFLSDWMELNKKGNYSLDDQGNLTALILRSSYNYDWIAFHNKNKWIANDITHYHSKWKSHFWQHSRFLLEKFFKASCPALSGEYEMVKKKEGLYNNWHFCGDSVYVSDPMITGSLQDTVFGKYVWWNCFEGFEIIKKDLSGNSYKGGNNSFILKKL